MTSMEITADIILDKTSIEVYIDDGALFLFDGASAGLEEQGRIPFLGK